MTEKQYLCTVFNTHECMKRNVFAQLLLLLVICLVSCEQPYNEQMVKLTKLTESQQSIVWTDTITPPANPFAPEITGNGMVTIVGALGLQTHPTNSKRGAFCAITTRNNTIYFLAFTSEKGAIQDVQFWRFDAYMLNPEYYNYPVDTIRVGDTIAVTGYPYAIADTDKFLINTYAVQKAE